MLTVLVKEVNTFLNSLVGYIVISVFLVGTGLFSWVLPQNSILESGYANLDVLFGIAPYIFMFLIPAITMRLFAEEKKTGTIELLLTQPLTDMQIIAGKYFAGLVLVVFSLLPTLVYYYTVYELGTPKGNIDSAATVGSYIGLLFLGAVFTAIGVFASSLTDNQIISFIAAFILSYLCYDGFGAIASINVWSSYSYLVKQLGIDYHYAAISRGVIDSRNVIYFVSVIVMMLSFTKLVLRSRTW
jgi:ABC-2 type transport system permease protein